MHNNRYSISRKIVIIVSLMVTSLSLYSQNWNLVWREDFGVAEDTVIKDFAESDKALPRHSFAGYKSNLIEVWGSTGQLEESYHEPGEWLGECGQIEDAQYGIANSSWWAYNRFKSCNMGESFFTAGRDHTGNKNGAMLIVNSEIGTGVPIYTQQIKFDLCDSREYKFVIYAASITSFISDGHEGCADLELNVVNTNTNDTIGKIRTGKIPMFHTNTSSSSYEFNPHADRNWTEYSCTFTAKDGDMLELQVTNWGSVYNDFVLDDISLYRNDDINIIDPTISTSTIASENKQDANTCTYKASFKVPAEVLTNWKQIYQKVYFLWQSSTDDGLTWNNLTDISGIEKTGVEIEVNKDISEVFRVIITGSSSENLAQEQALYIAEHGGPKDGCSYFSISNTLAGVSPSVDCNYYEGLRTIWKENFGTIDSFEVRASDLSPTKYYQMPNENKFEADLSYAITCAPDSAIVRTYENLEWTTDGQKMVKHVDKTEKSYQASGHTGQPYDAFLYTRIPSGGEKHLIVKKVLKAPFCKCKNFIFNYYTKVLSSWTGMNYLTEIVDNGGNTIVSEEGKVNGAGTPDWQQFTYSFSIPSSYTGDVTLKVYCINENNWAVPVIFDDFSANICSESIDPASLGIDNDKTKSFLGGFDCNDDSENHSVTLFADDWSLSNPNFSFVWQTSLDGITWQTKTYNTKTIPHDNAEGGTLLYRAILAESDAVSMQVATNGRPDDPCDIFYITDPVAINCKMAGCKAPIYQIDGDTVAEVCSDQSKAVKIVAVQQNTVKTDSKQWYSKPFNETSWTAITGATNETLEVSTLPADSTDYLFLAVNDTCTSDSVLFRLNVHQAITLEPLEDTILCMGKDIDIKAVALTGVPTKYIWNINPALTTEKLSLTSVAAEQSISVYATDGVCKSMPAEMDITVETPISFTDVDEINVCEGYQFIIDPKAGGDIKNIIWTRTDSEGNVNTLTDKEGETTLEEVAQESVTYGFKLQGNKCPTEIASVKVNVNPIPTITIEVSAEKICSGEDLSFTSEMTNAATVQYFYQVEGGTTIEQFGLSHNVVGETLDQNPTANARYWAIIPSDGYCPLVSTDTFFVEVEQPLDFKISDIPTSICAGSEVVNLEATLISGEPLETKWTSGSDVLTNELTTTDSPTAATTYTFTAHGDKCSPVESPFTKTYTVDVEKAANLTLTSSDDTICAGASLTLTAEYGDATSLTWESSTDGSHFTSFSAEVTSTQAQTPTTTTHYRLMTAGSGKCAQVPSNTVTVEVEQPLVFEISSNTPATICSGTPVNLSASVTEGTPTSYSWSNGETILSTESTVTDTPEKSTTYELTITANKCTVSPRSISVEVETVDNLTLAANSAKICKGTNVTLTATYGNASTLSWEVSTDGTNFTEESTLLAESRDVTPIATSTYRLKTAGKVCEPVYSDPVTIQVEQPIEFTLTPTPVTVCAGDLVALSATLTNGEATSYSWTKDGNPFVSELTTSDNPTSDVEYALSIKGDQCEAVTHSTSISVEQPVHLTLSTSNETICQGGSVTLSAGYETSNSLEWESSADGINYTPFSQEIKETQEVTPTATTFYRLKTSGTGACKQTFSDTVEVAVELPIAFTIQPISPTICEGTVVNLTAEQTSGEAKTITWKVNGTPFANTLQTTHQPTEETTNYELAIEGNTCSPLSKFVSVTMEKQPSLELSLSKTAVCKDTIVTLNLKHENCKGLSWKRKTAGSNSFSEFMQEMTDTYQLTANETTTFIVEATGNQACRPQPTNEVTLTVEQPVSVSLSGDQMICPGDHATITATVGGAPTATQWYKQDMSDSDFSLADMRGATVQVSPTRTTHYKLVANANYCPKADAEVTITVDEVPTLNISTSQNRICEGDELTVSTTFDYEPNITWTAETGNTSETIANGQKELSLFPTETTTYKVTAFSQANCPAGELSAKVIVDKAIVANLEDKDICQGDSVEIKCYGSPAYQYTWTSGNDIISQNSSVVVKPEETTSYNVKIVNGVCEETLETAITVHKLPQILSCEEISNKTYQMVAESDNQPLTYDFGNGKGATLSDVIENITYGRSYHITVTDNIGCQSDTTIATPSYDVIIPEYFNPENGEGWKITNIERFNNTTISIFDRFGKKLVELKGEDIEGWNGTYNGHDMPSTDYWYVVAIGELDRIYTGHFTLIR